MLIRHEPWYLFNELNHFLDRGQSSLNHDDPKTETSRFLPAVDIKEENHQLILFMDLPGVELKDIDISMENNILTIRGSRNKENIEDRKSYHRIERVKGHFYRRFSLPDSIDVNQINAQLKNGVLEIIVGKKTTPDTRKIQIELVK